MSGLLSQCQKCYGLVMKRVLILGGGGFIGGHAVKRLKSSGNWIRSVDIKKHEYGANPDEFIKGNLCDPRVVQSAFEIGTGEVFDEVYQFAADMGGAGYIFTGENDAQVMYNSALINLNVLNEIHARNNASKLNVTKVFYSSSACIYPEEIQQSTENPGLREYDAYPAHPDSEYGWEKLFSERLFLSFSRNYGIPVRIARFHNIFGPEGTWTGGREKSPAAICRKVAKARNPGEIEVWGDGEQTRSYLFVDECLDAVEKLMASDFTGPINIGSEEMVSINTLVNIVASVAKKNISINHVPGPIGVRGRNSNNDLIRDKLEWDYQLTLKEGIEKTYHWIASQIAESI